MKPGKLMMIFEDPITRKKTEGMATLVKLLDPDFARLHDGLVLQRWLVHFDDGNFERNILTDPATETE